MMDNLRQEREAAQILWDAISDEYNKWSHLSELERNEFTKAIAAWQTRQHQTDAQHDQLLQECLVKLRDVQGTQAPKQYACNLIKRIERVLQGQSNG